MKRKIFDQELLEELEDPWRKPERGFFQWLFGGYRRGVEEVEAYRLGRRAFQIWPQFLDAKVEAHDDFISGRILTLETQQAELERQGKDRLAKGGHALAIVIGFGILALALSVDYSIIHEFWTRALSDEFGEVPRSLASSVAFKSAQVIFATLAFHLFIETIGDTGRSIFKIFIFTLTFIMLLGIGIIMANRWLPAGSQLFGIDLSQAVESSQDMLADIGLGAPAAEAVAEAVSPGPITESDVKTGQTLLWLGALSLIFIIVTGVGALFMRFGIHGFQGIFGAITFDPRHPGAARLSVRASEKLRVEKIIWHYKDPKSRLAILFGYLARFVDSYHVGIHRYADAWGYHVGKRLGRHEMTRDRLNELNQAVDFVKRKWTEDEMRRRIKGQAAATPPAGEERPQEEQDESQEERRKPAIGDDIPRLDDYRGRKRG